MLAPPESDNDGDSRLPCVRQATSERGWRSAHETGATADDSRTGRQDSTSRWLSTVSDVRARVGGAVDERAELVALERWRASRPGGGRALANER